MNCFQFALRVWDRDNSYRIYYNSEHCINSNEVISGTKFLPMEEYGVEYFEGAFSDFITPKYREILDRYFAMYGRK